MAVVEKINRIFDKITFGGSVLSAAVLVLTMLTCMVDSIARWMGVPVLGVFEFNALLIGICIFLGTPFAQREKQHITVRLLTDRLTQRSAAILNISMLSLSAILFGWTSFLFYKSAYEALINHEVAQGISHFPLFPLKLVMFMGVALLTIQLVLDIVARVREVRGVPVLRVASRHERQTKGELL